MEEEIDLRPYVEALLRNWKWIIGAGILAALIALGFSFLMPSTYEATALVAVSEP
ncbi:MAG: lipopolysaccharide biosynthesis protein, partial [Chloroflexi bacterium]|nr:lipopolysaccharide biosynthesis protein [Chloroflexota bacterium]